MKKLLYVIPVLFTLYFSVQSMASDRLYVSDSFTITLRTGPSSENKIIRMLKSGQALDVLETVDKWTRVRALLNNGTEVEGWVRNQYLMERIPYESQTKTLTSENRKLKEKLSTVTSELSTVEKDKDDTSTQYSQTYDELVSLKKDYQALKKASSQYLELKTEYDENLAKLQSTEQRLKELEVENATIKRSQDYMWFASGAVVLLFGLIIGSLLGRQSRKRTSSYF